jgi:hypothetical protein
MYTSIKRLLRKALPAGLTGKHEMRLRYLLYQFYRGRRFCCNICSKGLRNFIRLPDGDKLCPNCGSLPRNRRLWDLLQKDFIQDNLRVLDFSPSRNISRIMKSQQNIHYTSTDLSGEFPADRHYDITQINLPDNSQDLIICYHVLEHVADDRKAMDEIYRILDSNGVCIIQTPFRDGETYEDPQIIAPEERKIHFGQADHVRIYSVEDLKERLAAAGFQVEVRAFAEPENNRYGFKDKEYLLFARKSGLD